MTSSTHIARGDQARAQDTLRWGGMLQLVFATGPSGATLLTSLAQASASSGAQLVNAHWRWPLSWRVALVLTPRFAPDETGALSIVYAVTVGAGDAQMTVERTLVIPASATSQYTSVIDTLVLPACDLLVRPSSVTTSDATPLSGPGSVEIGAFVAPETEPHAISEMLACLCRLEGGSDERRGDWMPPGFQPEPLGYRR